MQLDSHHIFGELNDCIPNDKWIWMSWEYQVVALYFSFYLATLVWSIKLSLTLISTDSSWSTSSNIQTLSPDPHSNWKHWHIYDIRTYVVGCTLHLLDFHWLPNACHQLSTGLLKMWKSRNPQDVSYLGESVSSQSSLNDKISYLKILEHHRWLRL